MADPVSAEAGSGLVSIPARRIDPHTVDRELARLLDAPEGGADGAQPVTRACMSNLLVYCESEAEAADVVAELAALVERHPARAVLLIGEAGGAGSELEAEVSALCYLAGDRRRVCAEHVRLAAPPDARRRLPSAVRPLLIGDLPTALWWAAADPPPSGEIFAELAAMAERVAWDSAAWSDPAQGAIAMADWTARERGRRRVADLAWARLRPWRRVIAETLAPDVLPGALEGIREVRVRHGPDALPAAWLLAGWMARSLGLRVAAGPVRPGPTMTWRFESPGRTVSATFESAEQGPTDLHEVTIASGGAAGERVARFEALGPDRISSTVDGSGLAERLVASPEASDAALLSDHLSEWRADPLFRDALEASRAMAEALAG